MPKDEAYLLDILMAARAVVRFTEPVDYESFIANEEKYEAVIRKFEIIGEAARRLSPEIREQIPEIPWRLLTAMRNVLIHDYDNVDLRIVWETAHKDVPALIARLEHRFK